MSQQKFPERGRGAGAPWLLTNRLRSMNLSGRGCDGDILVHTQKFQQISTECCDTLDKNVIYLCILMVNEIEKNLHGS